MPGISPYFGLKKKFSETKKNLKSDQVKHFIRLVLRCWRCGLFGAGVRGGVCGFIGVEGGSTTSGVELPVTGEDS